MDGEDKDNEGEAKRLATAREAGDWPELLELETTFFISVPQHF